MTKKPTTSSVKPRSGGATTGIWVETSKLSQQPAASTSGCLPSSQSQPLTAMAQAVLAYKRQQQLQQQLQQQQQQTTQGTATQVTQAAPQHPQHAQQQQLIQQQYQRMVQHAQVLQQFQQQQLVPTNGQQQQQQQQQGVQRRHSTTQMSPVDALFLETLHRLQDLQTVVSTCQAATTRTIIQHQQDQQKWRAHCLSFRNERDAARQELQVFRDEQQRITGRRNSAPTMTNLECVDRATPTGKKAKSLSSGSKRHSPYPQPKTSTRGPSPAASSSSYSPSSPSSIIGSDFADISSPSPSTSTASNPPSSSGSSSSNCAQNSRSSSSPPAFSVRPQTPTFEAREPVTRFVASERTSPASSPPPGAHARTHVFPAFASLTSPIADDDHTSFDVTQVRAGSPFTVERSRKKEKSLAQDLEGGTLFAPTAASISDIVSINREADLDLGSEEPASPPSVVAGDVDRPARAEDGFGIHHIDLMYIPTNGRLWCRACMFQRQKAVLDVSATLQQLPIANFPVDATWDVLKGHCVSNHPAECKEVGGLPPAQIYELRKFRSMLPGV